MKKQLVIALGAFGLLAGAWQRAEANSNVVPVEDLTLVEESEVDCPVCAQEDRQDSQDAQITDAPHHGGHGGHHGGHGGHHGGHHGHWHWNAKADGNVDGSELPQPQVEIR